ncbi:AraC family transcriptional regulator [bacterium]|nr:AraC family transcriptional regulator [bacterium]
MNQVVKLMDNLTERDGLNTTHHSSIKLYKASTYMPPMPLLYQQGIIIVGQGKKVIHVGDKTYRYDPNSYLVVTVPLPAQCETYGSKDEPFICMSIDIDMTLLNAVIDSMIDKSSDNNFNTNDNYQSLFVTDTDEYFNDAVLRLLSCLRSEVESEIIAPGIIKEIVYRIMCSKNAPSLYALTAKHTTISRIDKSLRQIHNSSDISINVEQLANLSHMSISGFHRAFKEVTSCSPIQYVKKVRLNKAKNLLINEKLKVNVVARNVGYESVTQFSREFKRYYGFPPSDLNSVR